MKYSVLYLLPIITVITLLNTKFISARVTRLGEEVQDDPNSVLTFPEWNPRLLGSAKAINSSEFEWTYDYAFQDHRVEVTEDGYMFKLTPNPDDPDNPLGSRISSRDRYIAGKVCFKPTLPVIQGNGTVLAVYVRSFDKEPNNCPAGDRWDILDFEFMGRHPGSVWVNLFSKKIQNSRGCDDLGWVERLPTIKPSHEFCIQWDARRRRGRASHYAILFVHDEEDGSFNTIRMHRNVITEPMKVKMAIWGKSDAWAGQLNMKEEIVVGVKDIRMWLAKEE